MSRNSGETKRRSVVGRGLAVGALAVAAILFDGVGVGPALSQEVTTTTVSTSGEARIPKVGADLDALAAAGALAGLMGGVFLALGRRRKPTAL